MVVIISITNGYGRLNKSSLPKLEMKVRFKGISEMYPENKTEKYTCSWGWEASTNIESENSVHGSSLPGGIRQLWQVIRL